MENPDPGLLDQLGRAGLVSVILGVLAQSFCCNVGWSEDAILEDRGRLVESTSHGMNYGAMILGPLGVVVGVFAIVLALRGPEETRTGRLIVAGIGTLLAAYGAWGSVW
jgi:hypothetical protein